MEEKRGGRPKNLTLVATGRRETRPRETLPIGVAGFEGGEKDGRRMASAITWSTRDIRDFACDDK